jgi:hypothetical protein
MKENLEQIKKKITESSDHIKTEEATKIALIHPFISLLGYDIGDPTQVIPEYTADVGIKKGEKVDYAIVQNGEPIIIIECKTLGAEIKSSHTSQLYRYFSVTKARIGILTDGNNYQIFSDLDKPNIMDSKPFLEFSVTTIDDTSINELSKLSKTEFDIENIVNFGRNLKWINQLKKVIKSQIENPDDEFVKFFSAFIYEGTLTQKRKEEFRPIVKKAFQSHINDSIKKLINNAIDESEEDENNTEPKKETRDDRIVTTEEELEGFHIVKSILRQHVDLSRVKDRDTISYFGILLDDNNRKPLCRLWFNSETVKYIGLFDKSDSAGAKKEERVKISNLNEIYDYSERLINTLKVYE